MHTISDLNAGVPAFLAKLWKLVEDPETNDLICWSPVSNFIIYLSMRQCRETGGPMLYHAGFRKNDPMLSNITHRVLSHNTSVFLNEQLQLFTDTGGTPISSMMHVFFIIHRHSILILRLIICIKLRLITINSIFLSRYIISI